MKKSPTRKGKAFKIPRPENSRPLIAAAIITIIALACGALALAGRIRPAEERQTPAYVPPTRPPLSASTPLRDGESSLIPKYYSTSKSSDRTAGCTTLRESGFNSLNQTSSDLAVHQHSTLKETAGATPSTIGTAGSHCTAQMTESAIAPPQENAPLEEYRPRAFLMSERNHLTRSTPVNSGMCRRTKAYGTLQSVPPPMSPSPQNS